MTTTRSNSLHFNIDKSVLRDIIEARATQDKQRFYYVVGSIFSGMSFTLLFTGTDNYSAVTFLTMIGIFFYSCVACNNVNYGDDERIDSSKYMVEGEDEGENEDTVSTVSTPNNTPMMQGMDGSFDVDFLTIEDKISLFKQIFYEIANMELEDRELEKIIEKSVAEPLIARADSSFSDGELRAFEAASVEVVEEKAVEVVEEKAVEVVEEKAVEVVEEKAVEVVEEKAVEVVEEKTVEVVEEKSS